MSSRLDSHPAYQEFLDWVRDNSQPGLIDPASDVKPFMLDANVLKTYFKANNHYRLNKLLRIAFPVGDIPIGPEKVADNCAQVFCTLVLIGRPEYIQRFVEYDHLQDSHLPFDDQYPPRHFPKCTTDQDQSEFLRRFCQEQWVVCAPKIDFREHRIFEDGQILPFKFIKRLGGGVSAHLYEIEICPTYNQLNSSNGAQQSSNHRITNTYVLKTYFGEDAERNYLAEVGAFRLLRTKTQSMIGFYGGFRHGDRYNIILEFADKGTLEDYFKKITPPTTGEEIITFWEHLFNLIEALLFVHGGEIVLNSDGSSRPLNGWHQDVKPSNILVTSLGDNTKSPYEWHFKLADLGVSHFKISDLSTEDATDRDSQGTRTYGAPECCRSDETLGKSKLQVTQTVDVWSLGAVFSVAAVWLVEGNQSLKEYCRDRQAAANRFPEVRGTDCFHDGQKVLDTVAIWHERLKKRLRRDDVITEPVLQLIECMLYDEKSRAKATFFWRWSRRILEKAKGNLKEGNVGSDLNTPTKPRPPTSPSISDSTSSTPSRPDLLAENVGQFGDFPRVLSPPALHETDNFDQGEMGGQLGRFESQRKTSAQVTTRYPQSSRQTHRPSVKFQDANNLNFNPNMGPRARSHDVGSAEPMHQVTRSMSGLPTHMENEFDQSSPGQVTAARNVVSMPPGTSGQFVESLYRTQRGETSDSFGTLRHAPESFSHNPYPHSDFSQGRAPSGNYLQGAFEDGSSGNAGPSRPPVWTQENFSQQQHPNVAPINYEAFNGDDHPNMPMSYWNQNKAPPGWVAAAQHPMQQHVESFPENGAASMMDVSRQAMTSTSPTQPSRYPLPETTSPMPESPPAIQQKPKNKPPAVLSVATAISVLAKGKAESLTGYKNLFPRLKQRDHLFIIDDALSMSPLWNDVEAVFGVMAKIVKAADPNGIDLHFTMTEEVYNSKNLFGINSSSKLVGYVQQRRSKIEGTVNITYRLDAILGPYTSQLSNAFSRGMGYVRPLNIYVLTDGVWEPGCDASSAIKNLVDKLIAFGYTKDSKQVGIQFISFGKNEVGLKRLKDLDDNLGQAMDIVDTTASNGNVWKMLLGAIDKTFDES